MLQRVNYFTRCCVTFKKSEKNIRRKAIKKKQKKKKEKSFTLIMLVLVTM